jgi:hypothetical protein
MLGDTQSIAEKHRKRAIIIWVGKFVRLSGYLFIFLEVTGNV